MDLARVEEIIGDGNPEGPEFVDELWPDPFSGKSSFYLSVRADAGLFKGEYFLKGDGLPFHAR